MSVLASLLGSVLGAIAISLMSFLLHLWFVPQLLHDGQYPLVYLLIAPQGAWLGGLTGYVLASYKGHRRRAGMTLLVGSVLFVAVALRYEFSRPFDWGELAAYFGSGLTWALGLALWAVLLVKPQPSVI